MSAPGARRVAVTGIGIVSALGNSLSVSYARVDSTTYTWKFRNDGYNAIKYLKFSYSYVDATMGYGTSAQAYALGLLELGVQVRLVVRRSWRARTLV